MSCTEVVPRSGTGIPATADNMADFGDFASTLMEQYDVESEAEPCEKYDIKQTSRVFYPIYIGEVLNGRYLVEHKIGFGGFSTVWMAHDLEEHTDVALKIMSLGEEWGEHEVRIQDEIARNVQDTSHLVLYKRTFLLFRGDGCGHHRVQVLPLVGPPLLPWILTNMSMRTRMFAARQLLETLENLHDAGIVHRDLNGMNCMWGFAPLHDLRRTAKYAALGRPSKTSIPGGDNLWKRGELVRPIEVPESLRTETFYLADFTLAMKVGDPVVPKGYPPLHFCSPDRLHQQEPSFACDIWSYMVLFGELYLGHAPFNFGFQGGIISCLTYCLGPLPEHWKGLYVYPEPLDFWYDQERMPDPRYDLASVIEKFRPDADPAEKQLVLSVMQKVFICDPEKRPTARQLLRDSSFRAIMERYGC